MVMHSCSLCLGGPHRAGGPRFAERFGPEVEGDVTMRWHEKTAWESMTERRFGGLWLQLRCAPCDNMDHGQWLVRI